MAKASVFRAAPHPIAATFKLYAVFATKGASAKEVSSINVTIEEKERSELRA